MRRGHARLVVAAASVAIGACNALTGAADLVICDDCGGPAITSPEVGPADAPVDVRPADADAGGKSDAADAADARRDADAAEAGIGCQGALACERAVFVTSTTYTGALGGIAGADAKCQAVADASPHPRVKGRTFQAWVSTPAVSVADRLPHGTSSYRRVDGTLLALDWTGLTSGSLLAPIRDDENATNVDGDAWTGTESQDGKVAGQTCASWATSSSLISGVRGNAQGSGGGWSSLGASTCNSLYHLYCFEY